MRTRIFSLDEMERYVGRPDREEVSTNRAQLQAAAAFLREIPPPGADPAAAGVRTALLLPADDHGGHRAGAGHLQAHSVPASAAGQAAAGAVPDHSQAGPGPAGAGTVESRLGLCYNRPS